MATNRPVDLTRADQIDPNDVLSQPMANNLARAINNAQNIGSGKGNYYSRFNSMLSRYDWFGNTPINGDHEVPGMTFITRPKLNLAQTSLRQDPVSMILDSYSPASMPFAIRCYLDPVFASLPAIRGPAEYSPFFNNDSPFIVPLTNTISHIDSFPNFEVHSTTSAEGYFGENQTTPTGSDFGNQSTSVPISFTELPGGFITSLFYQWIRWIGLMRKGNVMRYMDDIYQTRLSFTCSIYRFVLDSTRTYITKWMKYTGCYPYMIALGDSFSISDRSHFVSNTQEIQIQFHANHVEYFNPEILEDFNILTRDFNPAVLNSDRVLLRPNASNNFKGTPYISAYDGSMRLLRLADPLEVTDPLQTLIDTVNSSADSLVPYYQKMYNPVQLGSGTVNQMTIRR